MDHPTTVDDYAATLATWQDEFASLRPILLACGLDETVKWRKPCYCSDQRNIAIFQPFSESCALMFFKGALLEDPNGALREQGEHSRSAMRLEFRSVDEVRAAEETITALVRDAIRVEDAGLKVERSPSDEPEYPEELVDALESDPALLEAFQNLTPGRRRGWLLHFGSAKQSATRAARVERAAPRILEGFGLHD